VVTVTDRAGQAVAGFLHGELPVHQAAAGVVDRVDHGEQVHGLVDPPVLGERGPERGPSRPNIRSRNELPDGLHAGCTMGGNLWAERRNKHGAAVHRTEVLCIIGSDSSRERQRT
jgi:hypothetical protein